MIDLNPYTSTPLAESPKTAGLTPKDINHTSRRAFFERIGNAVNKPFDLLKNQFQSWDKKIDTIPNNVVQDRLDSLGTFIADSFAPLSEFSDWLNKTIDVDWKLQLAEFVVKLPLKAARNVILSVYKIIEAIFYAAAHPLKSANNLGKLIVDLLHELTKPEIYSKIGAGMLGASAAQAALGNPFSAIGLVLGAALVITGLSLGALKAAALAETREDILSDVKKQLFSQIRDLPEQALTGLFMGLLIGSIHKQIRKIEKNKIDNSPKLTKEKMREYYDSLTEQDFKNLKISQNIDNRDIVTFSLDLDAGGIKYQYSWGEGYIVLTKHGYYPASYVTNSYLADYINSVLPNIHPFELTSSLTTINATKEAQGYKVYPIVKIIN